MELFEGLEISQESKDQISATVEKLLTEEKATANVNANAILDGAMNKVVDTTGIERLASETKASDYFIRAVAKIKESSLKSNESAISERDKQISDLTAKIESGGGEALQSEFEKLKGLYNNSLSEKQILTESLEAAKTEYETNLVESKQNNFIAKSLPNLSESRDKFGAEFVDFKVSQAIAEIKIEHKLIFDDAGKLLGENKENYQKTFIVDLLKEKLKDISDVKKVGGNAGQGETGQTTVTNVSFSRDMNGIKKDEIVTSNLKGRGYVQTNIKEWAAEYQRVYSEAAKAMK